jgi:ubiquinol oxidase
MKILIRAIVSFFVFIVDVVYGNRPYPRFYLLETIARVPYFSLANRIDETTEFQSDSSG